MKNIYVDGQHGTTGLEIKRYIDKHPQFAIVEIDFEERHDVNKRKTLINASDAVVLCLPDQASKEAISLIESQKVIVVDTSTAFRTDEAWTYGLPEMGAKTKQEISEAFRIANPGCHATAALLALMPLQKSGLLNSEQALSIVSHTGYTGGGKEMINLYKNTKKMPCNQIYALSQQHKHIPEIMKYSNLKFQPTFMPIVGNYPRGILLSIPFHKSQFNDPINIKQLYDLFKVFYAKSPFAKIFAPDKTPEKLTGETNGSNDFEIYFTGSDENMVISVKLDNLGKGASGAVIQSLNLRFGFPENLGL